MKLIWSIYLISLYTIQIQATKLRNNQTKLSQHLQSFLQQEETEEDTIYYTPVVLLNEEYQPLDDETGQVIDQSQLNEQILESIEEILDQTSSQEGMTDNFQEQLFQQILATIQEFISEDIQSENDDNSVATLASENQNLFGLQDADDTQLVRTNNGIFEVRLIQDSNGALSIDIDEELENLRNQVNDYTNDLDDSDGSVQSIQSVNDNYDLDDSEVQDIDEISMEIYNSLRAYYLRNNEQQTIESPNISERTLVANNPIYFNYSDNDDSQLIIYSNFQKMERRRQNLQIDNSYYSSGEMEVDDLQTFSRKSDQIQQTFESEEKRSFQQPISHRDVVNIELNRRQLISDDFRSQGSQQITETLNTEKIQKMQWDIQQELQHLENSIEKLGTKDAFLRKSLKGEIGLLKSSMNQFNKNINRKSKKSVKIIPPKRQQKENINWQARRKSHNRRNRRNQRSPIRRSKSPQIKSLKSQITQLKRENKYLRSQMSLYSTRRSPLKSSRSPNRRKQKSPTRTASSRSRFSQSRSKSPNRRHCYTCDRLLSNGQSTLHCPKHG